ncbi:MAG: hypothetical protein ACJAVT_001502 [Yoonia sp.]|jgi:hypothetical protein
MWANMRGIKHVESLHVHLRVVLPPDGVFNAMCFNDKFVLGRTACVLASGDKESAALARRTLACRNGGIVQFGFRAVVTHITQPCDASIFKVSSMA